MAITYDHWEFSIQAVDAGGDKTSRRWEMSLDDTAGDITALTAAVAELITDFQAVSDAVIVKTNLNMVSLNDAFTLPVVGNVEEHALVTAPIYGKSNKSATIDIPAPKDTLFVGAAGDGESYNVVDPNDAALADYLADFAGGAAPFLVSDGETIDITSNVRGRRTHSHSTRG